MGVQFYDQYGNKLNHLTRWDSNVILTLPEFPYDTAPIFHFTTKASKTSKTVSSTLNDGTVSVVVPNDMLMEMYEIIGYVFLYDAESDEGRTIYKFNLPIAPKPKPDDYEYVDNTEIIELHSLRIRLEALIAQAEEAVSTRISDLDDKINDLDDAYAAQIQEIKNDIQGDVDNLNQSIADSRDGLARDITNTREALEADINSAKQALIDSIGDGSPKGYFGDAIELVDKPPGIYLYIDDNSEDNGYIFYWDGTNLSNRILYYAGIVVNDGSITYEKLSPSLQKQSVSTVLPYILEVEQWSGTEQEIVIQNYTATAHTKVDIDMTPELFEQLLADGCYGIYVVTNENNDNKVIAHAWGNIPSEDITIQLTIRETL